MANNIAISQSKSVVNMFPYIEIFGRDIGLYTLMILCGVFSVGIYANRMAKINNYDDIKIIIFLLILSTGAIVGSHLLYALVNYKNFVYIFGNIRKIDTFKKFFSVLNYTFGGSVFYGGLIGGAIVAYICIRKDKEYRLFIDIIAACIPLFHFWGRIGCFLGGCCYGFSSRIGFIYANSLIEEANGIRRFPVQLLEATFNLCLFFLLNYFLTNGKFKNTLLMQYLLIYSVGRFFLEFLRGDTYRGIWLFLSTSQIISIVIFTMTIWQYLLHRKSKKYASLDIQ
jgi:phosphatidylglycerol:prolipoprotein diacylglycerol transferase